MAQEFKILLTGDSSDLDKALSQSEKRLKQFGSKLTSVGKNLSLRLTAPISLLGGASIKMAAAFEESMNKVEVSFKSSAKEVKTFSKTALKSFGIAEGTALDMAALFGDMSTSMGLTTGEAAKMSTSLVGLAGDLASFKDINIDEVTTALSGVFTGETESLKRLGIVMTEVNLKQFAMEQGIKTNIKDMTQAQKVQLRYQYIMANTTNAQGDFARTSGSASNQMRGFQQGLKELGVLFGQVILPTFTKVIKKLNEWLEKLKDTSPETKTFIVAIGAMVAAIGPALVAVGSMITSFVRLRTAIMSLGTAKAGVIGLFIGAMTALVAIQDNMTEKLAPTLSFWERWKISMSSWTFKQERERLKEAEEAAKSLASTLEYVNSIRPKPEMQGTGIEQPYGLDLLRYGQTTKPKKEKEKEKPTELFTEAEVLEQEQLAEQLASVFNEFGGDINYNTKEAAANVEYFGNVVSNVYNSVEEKTKQLAEKMKINFASIAISIGQSLATAVVNGGNMIQALSSAILGGLGSLLTQMGKAAVAASELAKTFAIPIVGAAAGLAAIVLGTVLKGLSSKVQTGGFAAFANGGIVSGPTLGLMGEYPGAKSNPEVIAPLDKLKSMIGDRGGNVNVMGEFQLRGQDLVVALERAEKQRNRLG